MTTAYTSLLGLALPVTGELTGSWGDTVNNFITSYVDSAVAGTQTISGSQTAVTLSKTTNASLSQAGSGATGSSQYAIINCTGNPAGLLTITAPAASKAYLVLNNTSTNQSVKVVGAGPTTGVTVAAARCALIAWNGSDFELVATTDITALSGILATANGGTGLSTFTAANNALYSTSASALTAGTLPTAAGGTGLTTFTAANYVLYSTSASALTAGTLPVAAGGTGITSGTSGGVPYFSGSTTVASSAALAANALVVGGGAGAAPSTITTGTGVTTALGVNTGSAGAFVVNGGALGTPSSGTLSSCTVDGTNSVGFRTVPQNSQSTNYTLVLTDSGKHLLHPSADTSARTFTIPANGSVAFPIGTAVSFVNQNGAGTLSIAITTDTMRLAGPGTTGTRTLAANGIATAIKVTSTEWLISGTGLS